MDDERGGPDDEVHEEAGQAEEEQHVVQEGDGGGVDVEAGHDVVGVEAGDGEDEHDHYPGEREGTEVSMWSYSAVSYLSMFPMSIVSAELQGPSMVRRTTEQATTAIRSSTWIRAGAGAGAGSGA